MFNATAYMPKYAPPKVHTTSQNNELLLSRSCRYNDITVSIDLKTFKASWKNFNTRFGHVYFQQLNLNDPLDWDWVSDEVKWYIDDK